MIENDDLDLLNHLKTKPISKDMLKVDPHDLDDHFLSCKAVDFEVLKKYLDEEAWWELLALHKAKVEASTCPICSGLCLEKCVLCDHCFIWFHNKCAKVSQENIADVWKCSKCLKCKDCQ